MKSKVLGRGTSSEVRLVDGFAHKIYKADQREYIPQEVYNLKKLSNAPYFVNYVDHNDKRIIMEYIKGKELIHFKEIQYSWIQSIREAFQIAKDRGILIRNLNYLNILVDQTDAIRIVDVMDYVDIKESDSDTIQRVHDSFERFMDGLVYIYENKG